MENIRSVRLKHLQGHLGDLAYQLTKVQFSQMGAPEGWRPAINAYRCAECLMICVDLAGMDKNRIDLQVEPRRLTLRGYRQAPEPEGPECKPLQILVMEIDYGSFEREVILPADVDPEKVTAEQKRGLLWIYLPLRTHG